MILPVEVCLLLCGIAWKSFPQGYAFVVPTPCRSDAFRIRGDELMSSVDGRESVSTMTNMDFVRIDPLVAAVFFDEDSGIKSVSSTMFRSSFVLDASRGIPIWKSALEKGRLPTETEFCPENGCCWPPLPLYDAVYDAMVQTQLPRLALRHPETVPLILRSVLRTTLQYAQRLEEVKRETEKDEDDEDDHDGAYYLHNQGNEEHRTTSMFEILCLNDPESIAGDFGQDLVKKWDPVVNGMSVLDDLFGYDHSLLREDNEEDENGIIGGTTGFGIDDGIWSHTGWQQIPALQRQLKNLPELLQLVRSLGRRPTVEKSDRIHKFKPRQADRDGGMGAEFDPILRESVSGITLSASLSEMLPSEAVLLRGSTPVLRNLFLAKWVESKLLSYEVSGYMDIPSVPRTRPQYFKRLPSAPGGPIIVCLDTSWSMSGSRETLSKAVVLACVTQAHSQGRECQVIAFSTERQVMESGVITADPKGIQRLLEFLSYSFGGGTDVTGALKFVTSLLDDSAARDDLLSAADILLVTDGEIPDPPVSVDVMNTIENLKLKRGVEIHGLLIGKSESKPLSRLCTHTHNFLSNYHGFSTVAESRVPSLKQNLRRSGRLGTALYATTRPLYDEDQVSSAGGRRKKKQKQWRKKDDEWDEAFSTEDDGASYQLSDNGFSESVQESLKLLQQTALELAKEKEWTPEQLQNERQRKGSCWDVHTQLDVAVSKVEEGLVERGEEARLVVLAMIASEHILLLGSPGTAKSVLGLRLAELCDGTFFQRLLTRFTTPEELFGPLSLRSLEQDEYRRVTAGFLPTADIAFLDEIFKANSAILNTLLTILNERKFDNAGIREPCPIRCVVGASNELPESDELFALFDRFLIRKEVNSVSDAGLVKLLSMSNPGVSSVNGVNTEGTKFQESMRQNLEETIVRLSSAAEAVVMDADACELMKDLRTFLRENVNTAISDRRLVKTTRLMKLCAASEGRQKVDAIDFLVTQHCFWNEPDQRSLIREWLWENLTPLDREGGASIGQLRFLLNNLRLEILSTLRRTGGELNSSRGAKPEDVSIIAELREEAYRIATIIQEHADRLARHLELLRSDDFTWVDPDDVNAIKQLLLPRGELLWPKIKTLSMDAYAVALAISEGPNSPVAELREDVIELLWSEDTESEREFTEMELAASMKEAKAKYDLDTFRRWKRAKKKADKV
ncbi:phospholipid-translocating P-type ATPase, flippase [Nitzschia inconspicua]|uniref:Phospholipid-translocating P-type ATPase, flippase n=1 Tax=Nitzschia inconspicua TaxID=303405 RepID=A0A9K3M0X2_9STRA|nr:phospholipid-translocating P-type ATPase, flippase [Nitzschia inconspicua]